jgi:hypothetical protein
MPTGMSLLSFTSAATRGPCEASGANNKMEPTRLTVRAIVRRGARLIGDVSQTT